MRELTPEERAAVAEFVAMVERLPQSLPTPLLFLAATVAVTFRSYQEKT